MEEQVDVEENVVEENVVVQPEQVEDDTEQHEEPQLEPIIQAQDNQQEEINDSNNLTQSEDVEMKESVTSEDVPMIDSNVASTFTDEQLKVINLLLYDLKGQFYIPISTLQSIATEHWGKDFSALGYANKKETKRKTSAAKVIKSETNASNVSSTSSVSSSSCTYKFRKNHKTKGGQMCGKPCVANTVFCFEHNRKRILNSKDED